LKTSAAVFEASKYASEIEILNVGSATRRRIFGVLARWARALREGYAQSIIRVTEKRRGLLKQM